jgi:Domain of unknown function (DUF4276)
VVRLKVLVEGTTEAAFVAEVLEARLRPIGYQRVDAIRFGNPRVGSQREGVGAWSRARADLLAHLRNDRAALLTTMVDYYGMPSVGARAWPGRAEAAKRPFTSKASCVEAAVLEDVAGAMGTGFDRPRFLPFVVMHEFEGLLFSDCERLAQGIGQPQLAGQLQAIRDRFASPEEINDSPETAPSKRLVGLVPRYQKPFLGPLAALEIGLERIRAECPHFDRWVRQLEAWPTAFARR